ncbi:MAG TPA: hypothetical protein VFD92_04535 [Candidatus Binatia bacterium]|nr:hypothetical protein [Candidatus Binatia bacterium]
MDEAILRALHQATDLAREIHGWTTCVNVGTTARIKGRDTKFKAVVTHSDTEHEVSFGETPLIALRKLVVALEAEKLLKDRAAA